MTHTLLDPFSAVGLPESADPAAASAAAYANEVVELLSGLLLGLVRERQPELEPALRGERPASELSPDLLARTLQVQGLWFQLLSIAEQNAAMRRRRQTEADRGYDQVRGTFAQVISSAAAAKVSAEELRKLLEVLRVRPVITAHPTEAKRVTVLEKHRRIYRRLVDLESPRWTPRERQALVAGLQDEIELLWNTGELRLAKPTVPQEVFWALHFFNETLFDSVPDLLEKLERALTQAYPAESFQVTPFFQFGSSGRRRSRRQSVRDQFGHPGHAPGEPAHWPPPLPPPSGRTGPGAQHNRARHAGAGELSNGPGEGVGSQRSRR